MPFGSERALIAAGRPSARFYALYGAARMGDKIRASHVMTFVRAHLRPGADVLDAGCSMGFYSLYIARHFPAGRILAIDVNREHLEQLESMAARLRLTNVTVRQCELEHLDSQQEFDLALCVDVLEHTADDQSAIDKIAHSLRPGGTLIVHVPQRFQRHILSQPEDLDHWEHAREGYTPSELSQVLDRAGLRIVASRNTFGIAGALGHDLDECLQHVKPVWAALLPLILLLGRMDSAVTSRRGNGLLVVAQRPGPEEMCQ